MTNMSITDSTMNMHGTLTTVPLDLFASCRHGPFSLDSVVLSLAVPNAFSVETLRSDLKVFDLQLLQISVPRLLV